jgi:hypothetical protein
VKQPLPIEVDDKHRIEHENLGPNRKNHDLPRLVRRQVRGANVNVRDLLLPGAVLLSDGLGHLVVGGVEVPSRLWNEEDQGEVLGE